MLEMPSTLNLRYAGIGSREAPDNVLKLTATFANILAELGYSLYSGGCPIGMDNAFAKGAYSHKTSDKSKNRIYIAWNGMGDLYHDPVFGIYDATRFENREQAKELAYKARGSFEGLKQGGILLHSRNPHQVLGDDLNSPVEFVLTWAKPVGKQGHVKGGTGTAVAIALEHKIPVYNLYYEDIFNKIYSITISMVMEARSKREACSC